MKEKNRIHYLALKIFTSLAWERHRIYVLKELGMPKPWTENEILKNWYFCNVFRAVDKTSKWIINKAIKPNDHCSELWKTILMCRYISRIGTLQKLLDNKCLINDQRGAYNLLREMQANKEKIFTNAFIVNSKTSTGWKDKVSYLFFLIKAVYEMMEEQPDTYIYNIPSMEILFRHFRNIDGVGDFMAYQYTIDFTYSKRYLANADDKQNWTVLGLGAVRGMNRLISGTASREKIPDGMILAQGILAVWKDKVEQEIEQEMKKTQMKAKLYCNTKINLDLISEFYNPFRSLTMMDVQHWLCEYDKYMRGGSKKRRYNGER